MDLHVRLDNRAGLAAQIYGQLRDSILDGHLRPAEALPSSRDLAVRLGVSRNTVSLAYDRLVAEGYLTARAGSGTFVSDLFGSQFGAEPSASPRPPGPLRARPAWAGVSLPADLSDTPAFDFRVGVPDAQLFPYPTWRRLLTNQLRASVVGTGMPCEPAGHAGLRAALARHLRARRAVEAEARDILVTAGVQQALDLIGRVLLDPGTCVAVEEPGYFAPWLVWRSHGAHVVGAPVDDEGLIVDALPPDARLVYVTPSHQFPTGAVLSMRRRLALLSWARRHDAAIVEDDYDSEYRYTDQPLEPLHSLDRSGRVLYVGSFSKVLLPTLRVGYLVHPASLRQALHAAKFVTDWHTNLPVQAALADFIDRALFARHISRTRRVYRHRHELVAAALAGPLSGYLTGLPSAAGMHCAALAPGATAADLREVLARARAAGVAVFEFSDVAITPPDLSGIVLGYGPIAADRIPEGLHRLYRCFQGP